MASVNFLYRSTKEKANLILRLLYRFNNVDYTFGAKTKFEIDKIYWSKQHKKKSKDIDITNKQTEVNTELNKFENHVLKAFNSVSIETINKDWLQTQIDYYYNPPKQEPQIPNDLISYINYYTEIRDDSLTVSNKRKIISVKNKLIKFQKSLKETIYIEKINETFKIKFIDFCKNNFYANSTINRDLKHIKTFCIHAEKKGLNISKDVNDFKIQQVKAEKIYLTFEDLIKIETISKEKLTDSLDNAKDWLIISAYCGQRVSDFMNFTDEQIRIEDGKHLIEFTQKKTSKVMTVPLHPKILEILKKRNGNFPYKISDQKYNDFIKVVCELAEINEPTKGSKLVETEPNSGIFRKKLGIYKKFELVTSHIGRRSFASNFYGKIPTTYLIYVTGHSTEAMFLNYIGKSNKDLALEITNYF